MEAAEAKRLLDKERLEKDVIARIMYDRLLDGKDFSVRYLDRVTGRLVDAPYDSITADGDFFRHDESLIPMHRIREVCYKGTAVWAKRRNI
ncbi:MAG: DUF504 domain-containing protein [Candidatus Altiarchaeota archaeon]|nr:DUF504 domain-containing protein [Candidatus Altiarchaeota archaeon]